MWSGAAKYIIFLFPTNTALKMISTKNPYQLPVPATRFGIIAQVSNYQLIMSPKWENWE